MSVSFYGRAADGAVIALDFETDAAHLNMANGNARAFLLFLSLEPGADPSRRDRDPGGAPGDHASQGDL